VGVDFPGISDPTDFWVDIYLDRNRDGIFQTTENVSSRKFTAPAFGSGGLTSTQHTISLTPTDVTGDTRIRVIFSRIGNQGPCDNGTFTGEVEDYIVSIIGTCPTLSANITPTNASCPGQNGSLVASGTGGTAPYSYSWSNGSNGATLNAAAGTYTVTVTDKFNCTGTASGTIGSTPDNTAPTASCPANMDIGNTTGVCGATVTYSVNSSDACGVASTTKTNGIASGGTFPIGTTNNSFTVTDVNGNSASCSFSVTVSDTEDPTVSCPSNIVQSNDANSCGAQVSYTVTGSDNCSGSSVTKTSGLASGSTFSIGNSSVSFSATDAAGNTSTCSFMVTVNDTQDPGITCPSNITKSNDQGVCNAVVTYSVTSSDNCTGETISQSGGISSGSTFSKGNTVNSFTVTDASGNTATCSFSVTVNDTEAPVATCPANINQSNDQNVCGATITFSVGSSDNCPTEVLAQTGGIASGNLFPIGTTNNTFTVTDVSGNTATCSFSVIIKDTQLPTVTCPANVDQNNDSGVCGAAITHSATSADNCPNEVLSTDPAHVSGSTFSVGNTVVTYTVTDANNNTASCSFSITIRDTEDPTITCPNPISRNNDQGVCGADVTYTVNTSDNCPNEILTQDNGIASGSTFSIGTTTNVFTVTDANGLTATCSFQVTITDVELPSINCPTNLVLGNDQGQCGRQVTYGEPNGSDNCGSTSIRTAGQGSGTTFGLGTSTETYQVTDASGNTATCSFSITINDTENPVISLLGDNPVFLCEGESYIEAGATASDNCDNNVGQNILINANGLNINQEGNYNVIYTVTDVNGNSASQVTRAVIVKHQPAQLAPQNCGSCSQIRFDFCEGGAAPDLEALLTANINYEPGVNFIWYADNSNSQGSWFVFCFLTIVKIEVPML